MQTLGLVLLPEPSFGERVVEFAEAAVPNAGMPLQVVAPGAAHVSVIHVTSDRSAEDAWAQTGAVWNCDVTIRTTGLNLLPHKSAYLAPSELGGGLYVYLQVAPDAAYVELQNKAFATSWFRDGEAGFYKPGATLNPHFTLGITTPEAGLVVNGPIVLSMDLFASVPAKLALGRMGEHGVLEEVLAGGW